MYARLHQCTKRCGARREILSQRAYLSYQRCCSAATPAEDLAVVSLAAELCSGLQPRQTNDQVQRCACRARSVSHAASNWNAPACA
jgi:hypothetical protein